MLKVIYVIYGWMWREKGEQPLANICLPLNFIFPVQAFEKMFGSDFFLNHYDKSIAEQMYSKWITLACLWDGYLFLFQ